MMGLEPQHLGARSAEWLVNDKETRLADPTCGGNGVGDHERHSVPLTPYRVSSVGVSADMVESARQGYAPGVQIRDRLPVSASSSPFKRLT